MITTQFPAANPRRERLEPGTIQLWRIDLAHAPDGLGAADLSADERDRFARLHDPEVRRWRIACRLSLRFILGCVLDLPPAAVSLATGANGRPLLTGRQRRTGIAFNVSHAGPLAVIAVAELPRLGVDIERHRPVDLMGVARRMYHESEQAALARLHGTARALLFFRIWTAKEALLKAEGTGIFHDPAAWQLALGGTAGAPLAVAPNPDAERDGAGWRLEEFSPQPGVSGTLAASAGDWTVRYLALAPELMTNEEI